MAGFVREKAGLGSPPAPFYTNAVESKNNILKQHLGRKLSSLPEFVDKMKSLLTDQYQEVEKAVASCGEYRVSPRYSHLVYDKLKWFKMSVKQRENKVASFMKFRVDSFDCFREERNVNPLCELKLPNASTVWERANDLLDDSSAIVPAPGDPSAFMVKSNTGQQPHYVKPSKAGGFLCDDKCLGFKSAKVCSHTVACALKEDNIANFLRWYKGLKAKPNFTSLSEYGKPSSAGKKPRKGVSKKRSKEVQNFISNTRESDFTPRIRVVASSQQEECRGECTGSDPMSNVLPSIPVSIRNYGMGQQYFGMPPTPCVCPIVGTSSTSSILPFVTSSVVY